MCIDTVAFWFGNAKGQILSTLTELSARHMSLFLFPDDNVSKCKLGMCTDIVDIWFGIANGQFFLFFFKVICWPHDSDEVLSFHIFILHFVSYVNPSPAEPGYTLLLQTV